MSTNRSRRQVSLLDWPALPTDRRPFRDQGLKVASPLAPTASCSPPAAPMALYSYGTRLPARWRAEGRTAHRCEDTPAALVGWLSVPTAACSPQPARTRPCGCGTWRAEGRTARRCEDTPASSTTSPSAPTADCSPPRALTTRYGCGTERAEGRTARRYEDTPARLTTSPSAPTADCSPPRALTTRYGC